MSRIDTLRKNYQRVCGLNWDRNVAGPQRVWVAVYDKEDERKLRLRLPLFEEATHQAGHAWHHLDFTSAFADWLCGPPYADYAESYFAAPARLGGRTSGRVQEGSRQPAGRRPEDGRAG